MKFPITITISKEEMSDLLSKKALDKLGLYNKNYNAKVILITSGVIQAEVTITEAENE